MPHRRLISSERFVTAATKLRLGAWISGWEKRRAAKCRCNYSLHARKVHGKRSGERRREGGCEEKNKNRGRGSRSREFRKSGRLQYSKSTGSLFIGEKLHGVALWLGACWDRPFVHWVCMDLAVHVVSSSTLRLCSLSCFASSQSHLSRSRSSSCCSPSFDGLIPFWLSFC